MADLTRKAFYDLALQCRELSEELARHEQDRVNVALCHRFNQWLPTVLAYDVLRAALPNLTPARPLTRGRLMAAAVAAILLLTLIFQGFLGRFVVFTITALIALAGITLLILPERFYGATVALIEAKVLRVVLLLEEMLLRGEMGFTEAAFFVVKENLAAAHAELRQQIHLAKRW